MPQPKDVTSVEGEAASVQQLALLRMSLIRTLAGCTVSVYHDARFLGKLRCQKFIRKIAPQLSGSTSVVNALQYAIAAEIKEYFGFQVGARQGEEELFEVELQALPECGRSLAANVIITSTRTVHMLTLAGGDRAVDIIEASLRLGHPVNFRNLKRHHLLQKPARSTCTFLLPDQSDPPPDDGKVWDYTSECAELEITVVFQQEEQHRERDWLRLCDFYRSSPSFWEEWPWTDDETFGIGSWPWMVARREIVEMLSMLARREIVQLCLRMRPDLAGAFPVHEVEAKPSGRHLARLLATGLRVRRPCGGRSSSAEEERQTESSPL